MSREEVYYPTKLERSEVYKIIDTERDYQDANSNNWNHVGKPTVEAEILMMEEYLARARSAWVNNNGKDAALDMMRKVVGIAVRCFENHGVNPRN